MPIRVDYVFLGPKDPLVTSLNDPMFLNTLGLTSSISLNLSFSAAVSKRAPSAFRADRNAGRTTIMYVSHMTQIDCAVTVDSTEQMLFEMRWRVLAALESSVKDPERTISISMHWQYGPQGSTLRLPVLSNATRTLRRGAWEARRETNGSLLGFSPSAYTNRESDQEDQ